MLTDCLTCMHFDRCDQEDRWYGCINYKPKPMTNAERIRAMADEELAELLHSQFVFSNSYLPSEWWLDWLKQEAEE